VPRAPRPYAELERGRTRLRFFHGDAIDTLKALGAGSIDAIVTSPPYNLGIQYRSYDDGRPRAEYLEWTSDWIKAARRALAEDGSLFLNVKGREPEGQIDPGDYERIRDDMAAGTTTSQVFVEKISHRCGPNLTDWETTHAYSPLSDEDGVHVNALRWDVDTWDTGKVWTY
jgi:hypothetical protein